MIRLVLLSFGFVAVTVGLLWTLGAPPETGYDNQQEVSRGQPAPFDTTFVNPQPVGQVEPQIAQDTAAMSKPEPVESAAAPTPVTKDKAQDAFTAMSYGILSELQKPAENPGVETAQTDPFDLYQVRAGDSLQGIAFEFYGSTIGSQTILNANRDQLKNGGDLSDGMILRIPRSP